MAKKIGVGGAHALAKLTGPDGIVDSVTGKKTKFSSVKQYQSASNNGVDALGQISEVDPPPPKVGDFVSFEIKSTLGVPDDPPSLSRAQRDPVTFNRTRLGRALDEDGSFPELEDDDLDFLEKAIAAMDTRAMHHRRIGVRMDHAGHLGSTNGKREFEVKSWA